jgi:hypothetical protein
MNEQTLGRVRGTRVIRVEIADQLHLAQSGFFEHLNEWSVGKGTTQSSGFARSARRIYDRIEGRLVGYEV